LSAPARAISFRTRTEGLRAEDRDMGTHDADPFWEDPEVVETFASRAPDHRLQGLVEEAEDPSRLHALDVGCAGGRNTVYLAQAGVDVHAVDASAAMVARTRARLAEVLGAESAEARVLRGLMDDLRPVADASMDLVVVLGVLHSARSLEEWHRAIREIRRVLKPGGRTLVSNFSPDSLPHGRPLAALEGEPDRYLWREGRRMILLDPARHDAAFAAHGLLPAEDTEAVRVPLEDGYRVSVNALYMVEAGSVADL
jgi:SAM-dependent methyltransferase